MAAGKKKQGKKRDDRAKAGTKKGKAKKPAPKRPSRFKERAVTKPVSSPEEALAFWARAVGCYYPFVVNVDSKDGALIAFHIWDVQTQKLIETQYDVDLTDGERVWGDLPSTAQYIENGDPVRYGLIFFTETWLTENGVAVSAGGAGKWPDSLSL